MATSEIGNLLNHIGQCAADLLGKPPLDVFVYIRAGDQWMEGAIFDNLENEVIYHTPNDDFVETVLKLWDAAESDKKWEMIHLDIKNGQFVVEYFYPDQLDPNDVSYEHRERALMARYGDKPVIYPKPDDGEWGHLLTEDDLADDDLSEPKPTSAS